MSTQLLAVNPKGYIALIDSYNPIDIFHLIDKNNDLTFNLPTYLNS